MDPQPNGWVETVSLKHPTLQDNTADADRLREHLRRRLNAEALDIDLALLRELPGRLREADFELHCLLCSQNGRWTLAAVSEAASPCPFLGLAVDLGTSRVVTALVDLASGETLGESAFDNPQIRVGPDVLARIHFAGTPGGLQQLQQVLIRELQSDAVTLCRSAGKDPGDICMIAAAGNTTMTHLFIGLDPRWLIREPYIPAANRFDLFKASDLGLSFHPGARVVVFPNIGSYFGGDLISGILYSGLHRSSRTAVLVDVGTNAEVVLGNQGWLIACAGAAGPALEGGVTRMGMMAGPGVIDRVAVDPVQGRISYHTIGDTAPKGICGSGLIDLAAQLFLAGMLDIRGKFVPDRCGGRLVPTDGEDRLEIVGVDKAADATPLSISQAEIDSLVRSKAAMYTILETITGSVGVSFEELAAFYVAGTFGSFIDPRAAIALGMLPDLPIERYRALGNSSLQGAVRALVDRSVPAEMEQIRDRITYLELNVNQDFMNRFSAAKFLPHTDPGKFPSVIVSGSGRR